MSKRKLISSEVSKLAYFPTWKCDTKDFKCSHVSDNETKSQNWYYSEDDCHKNCDFLKQMPRGVFKSVVEYAPGTSLAELSTTFNIDPLVVEKRKQELAKERILYDLQDQEEHFFDIEKELNVGNGIYAINNIIDSLYNSNKYSAIYIATIKRFIDKYIKKQSVYIDLLFAEVSLMYKRNHKNWKKKRSELLKILFGVTVSEEIDEKSMDVILFKCGIPNTKLPDSCELSLDQMRSMHVYNEIKLDDIVLDDYKIATLAILLQNDNFYYHTAFDASQIYYKKIFLAEPNKLYLVNLMCKTTPSIMDDPQFVVHVIKKLPKIMINITEMVLNPCTMSSELYNKVGVIKVSAIISIISYSKGISQNFKKLINKTIPDIRKIVLTEFGTKTYAFVTEQINNNFLKQLFPNITFNF